MSFDRDRVTQPHYVRPSPPLPESVQIMVVSGPDLGTATPLGMGPCVVGQSHGCDLVLHDRTVSRRHLEARRIPGAVRLRDLGSKNGSYFHEIRFSQVDVTSGAVVCIGTTELKVVYLLREI